MQANQKMAIVTKWFVTGIGTGVGKTFVSTILAEYFSADYWKPVQAGDLECSDSLSVSRLVSHPIRVHPERYALQVAASPLQAAGLQHVRMRVSDFQLPDTDNHLIVEGAGGLFVPLNDQEYIIDLMKCFKLNVVLVIRDYLGCINHSLLSLAAIQHAGLTLVLVVFNGEFNPWTLSILKDKLPAHVRSLELPELSPLNSGEVKKVAAQIRL